MLHIYTYSTNPEKVECLMRSAELHSLKITNLSKTNTWNGFQDRINAFHEELTKLPDTDIFCFVDAYDVIANANEETILKTYRECNKPIVFNAEIMVYPFDLDTSKYPTSPTPFRFLNAGCFIGTVAAIKDMYQWTTRYLAGKQVSSGAEDQGLYQAFFLQNQDKVHLDVHAKFAISMAQIPWQLLNIQSGEIEFVPFKTKPCFLHFNGMSYLDVDHDFTELGDNKKGFNYNQTYTRTFLALIGAKFLTKTTPTRVQLTSHGHTYAKPT